MSGNGSTEHSEDLDYRLEDDAPVEAPVEPSGGRTSALLFLAGCGMTATGLALALAPEYSWTVTKFARGLVANGVDFGALIAGGFVLVGLGLVARRLRPVAVAAPAPAPAPEPAEDSNDSFLLEQLSEDVAHVRASVSELTENLMTLSSEQQAFREERREQAQESPETPMGQQQNALFRLAASLDQLGAHFDERLEAHVQTLRTRFDEFNGALGTVQGGMSSLQRIVTEIQNTPAPAPASVPEPQLEAPPAPLAQVESPSEDDPQVVVDLESQSYDDGPVLDFFEDVEGLEEEAANPYQEPPPALPSPESGFGAGLGASAQPPSSWESSLEKLLPDDNVRDAIDRNRDE